MPRQKAKKQSFRKIKQLADLQSSHVPAAISLFFAKEAHNINRYLDLEEKTLIDKASIDRSLSVLADTSLEQIMQSAEIAATSADVCAIKTEQEPNNVRNSTTQIAFSYTSMGAPA